MTQNYAVDQKKPSALPGMILSAGTGAVAGWGLSKIEKLQGPRYGSWDDILKESKDSFKKLGESVKDNKDLKAAYDAIAAKKTDYANKAHTLLEVARSGLTASVDSKVATEHAAYVAKRGNLQTKLGQAAGDLVGDKSKWEAIGFKEFLGDGADKLTDEQLIQKAKKFIKKNPDKKEFGDFKTAREELKTALKALKDKAKTEGVSCHETYKLADDAKNTLKDKIEKLASTSFDEIKDKTKLFKSPRTGMMIAAGAALGVVLGLLVRPKAKKENAMV